MNLPRTRCGCEATVGAVTKALHDVRGCWSGFPQVACRWHRAGALAAAWLGCPPPRADPARIVAGPEIVA